MKKQFIVMCLILALVCGLCGCVSNETSTRTPTSTKIGTGMNITIKQAIPINPSASIELSKPINLSNLSTGKPLAYLLENAFFEIPFDIQNNNKFDYDNVLIKVSLQSPMIQNMSLYSYSGSPLTRREDGTFSMDSKSISRQTNSLLLIGKIGNLPGNLSSGEFYLGIELYNSTLDQQIPNAYAKKKLKVCKQNDCN
jgi:hypothetical protein